MATTAEMGPHLYMSQRSWQQRKKGVQLGLPWEVVRSAVKGQENENIWTSEDYLWKKRCQAHISNKYEHLFGTWRQYKILAVGNGKVLSPKYFHMILIQEQDSAEVSNTPPPRHPRLTQQVFTEHLKYYRLSTVPAIMGDAEDGVWHMTAVFPS